MKVIVSHDVDHISPGEHWKDLYYPKLWFRSFVELLRRQISFRVFWNRLVSVFDKRINRIPELCEFDCKNDVDATYFFGMAHALGMDYNHGKALPWIKFVKDNGFDAGVHGCDYQHLEAIRKEHDDFARLTGCSLFGIRNHYVRYDNDTFFKMSQVGYLFDTSEFNKEKPTYRKPYKIGKMWEFPLAIMEGYVVHYDLQEAQKNITEFVQRILDDHADFLTILFHDSFYNEKCYPVEKAFYEWLIGYLKSLNLEFVSYRDAIIELENGR